MKIADLFRRSDRRPEPSRCICGSTLHHAIDGDGPLVCPALMLRAGDAAARPGELSEGVLAMLQEAHGEVVELVEVRLPRGRVVVWRWLVDENGAIA